MSAHVFSGPHCCFCLAPREHLDGSPGEHVMSCPAHPARASLDAAKLLTDALDFIAELEFGDVYEGHRTCLDCGAGQGTQHSENCRWLALMRRGGRR